MTKERRLVLVVDDRASNRMLAVAFMTKLGWETAQAEGGEQALAWLDTHPDVDLLLLDISMPDLCGEDVCLQLRADPRFATLPIVAYTAHVFPSDVDRFLANGFSAVLLKPVTFQMVASVVQTLFPGDQIASSGAAGQ